MLNGKNILITGGTGSFGKKCTETILQNYKPNKLVIFSRDELKQYEMSQSFPTSEYPCMRYFLGDVRDKVRLHRALNGIDYVIHAAALKQVPAAEYNPFEAVKTNVIGAQNIVDVSIDKKIKKVIALSTDKAANPINVYGATKLCSDKLFVAGNSYVGRNDTRFSVVRYGNVVGSRGSVIPFFIKQKESGILTITDPSMTRFWITLDQGVSFVLRTLELMVGGEIFIPKIPSMKIIELAKAICPTCHLETVGIRAGEKLHEVLIPKDDARNTVEFDDYFVIKPEFHFFKRRFNSVGSKKFPFGFEYSSDKNSQWLTTDELKRMI
jgi:UDP-N-acetylglucosamine 4,6-dehydratase